MQVVIDPYDRATAYADLRSDEPLSGALRERALERARELGAERVEFWKAPYGRSEDRMDGFVELVRLPAAVAPGLAELTETDARRKLAQS